MLTLKKVFVYLVLVLFTSTLFARPVDKTEALSIAKQYFASVSSSTMRIPSGMKYELAYTCSESSDQRNDSFNNYFYVFNIGQNQGFVIVSADSRTKKVLGYSHTGSFDMDRIPDNMKSWLEEYANEIRFAAENIPDAETENTVKSESIRRANLHATAVEPLLGNISYDQGKPYNDSCPALSGVTTVTGCGATAMVQVMRYYKWPVNGTGTNSYTSKTNSFNLSADFGNTTYDWANMLPYYNTTAGETNAQKAAIAKLMLHAGISINMDYNTSANGGSNSYTTDIPLALYDHFGYDAGIQLYQRKYVNYQAWENILNTELNAGRPVLYRGATADNAGHIFVCDGYDANGMYHFNWGWGGTSNGYFELSALNTDNQGIGSNNDGYNFGHFIVTGIQKPKAGSVHSPLIAIDSISPSVRSIPRLGSVTLGVKRVINAGAFDYLNSMMGISLLLSQNGVAVDTLIVDEVWSNTLPPNYYFSTLNYDVLFKSNIPNGDYKISVLYRNEKNKYVPVLVNNSGKEFLNVKITDTQIYFISEDLKPNLYLESAPVALSNLYQNKNGNFELKIKNTGTKEYYAQIGVRLTRTDDAGIFQDVVKSVSNIQAGETVTLQIGDSIKTLPGTYYLNVYYDAANNQNNVGFPASLMGPSQYTGTVTVYATPTVSPALAVVSGTYVTPLTITKGLPYKVKADVSNTGGLFDGNMVAFIFRMTAGSSVAYYGYQHQLIDNNQTRTVEFSGEITDLDTGDYRTAIYYHNGSSWSKISDLNKFTLVDNLTSAENQKSDMLRILEVPVASELKFSTPAGATSAVVYNSQGRVMKSVKTGGELRHVIPVNDLTSGVYMVKITLSDGKILCEKFIKR